MAKFYAAAVLLTFIGMFAYYQAGENQGARWTPILIFFGGSVSLTGLAYFVLAFGYHVRSTAMKSPND